MACEWDNPGLLAGRKEKEVKKLLLCVDADDEAWLWLSGRGQI